MNITPVQGNALDLSVFNDEIFDVTLIFGPLYHLYSEEEKTKVINEAIRVTKKGGYIFLAYISNYAAILSYGLRKGNMKRIPEMILNKKYQLKDDPEEIFSTVIFEDLKEFMKKFDMEKLHYVGVDGVISNLAEMVNNLDEVEFENWLDYHFNVCEMEELMGYSSHILYVGKKN